MVSQKVRAKCDDIRKEIRVSLNTSKKREALLRGCALYAELSDLFLESDTMKDSEHKKYDEAIEEVLRVTAKHKAMTDLKRERMELRKKANYREQREKLLTDEDRKNGLSSQETTVIELNEPGKYQVWDVVREYLVDQENDNDWIKKTKDTKRRILSLFAGIMGNRYFDQIRKEHLIDYKNFISKLPCGYSTDKRFKKMSLGELVATNHEKVLSRDTIGKHISTVKSLFDWAVNEKNYTDQNYAKDLSLKRIRRKGRERKERERFSKAELQKIFSGPEYRGEKGATFKFDAFFWCPLIGLYTGARIDEICRLRVDDIREDEDVKVRYIAFNSKDGEGKTESSKRNTPIHEMLIQLGFLNFVNRQRRHQHTRLFPELKFHQSNGYGAQVSKWFDRFLVKVGVKDPAIHKNIKVFHSFRHTLINHLQEKGVSRDRIRVFEGHEIPDEYSYYQHGLGLKTLADEVVAKIDFEIDFSHLMSSERNPYRIP